MAIKLDQAKAKAVLGQAIQWAEDTKRDVPETWAEWTREIATAPSRTFTAALGTALLAKATDSRADPLALKAVKDDKRAYSARTLCHGILVPASVEHGFDLGATGREPLNNQPFFRYDRIDEMARVHAGARGAHGRLVECLKAVDKLSDKKALAALAAFLRVRLEIAVSALSIDLRGAHLGIAKLNKAVEAFINENTEGGRRGQAIVAAAFDLAFEQVRMGRVNDPSRRFPGDVQALRGTRVMMAAEVRQKPVSFEETMQFASSVRAAGVGTGLLVALHPAQKSLNRRRTLDKAEKDYGILMTVIDTVEELIVASILWSGKPIEEVLLAFPERAAMRLAEIEVRPKTLQRWRDLVKGSE